MPQKEIVASKQCLHTGNGTQLNGVMSPVYENLNFLFQTVLQVSLFVFIMIKPTANFYIAMWRPIHKNQPANRLLGPAQAQLVQFLTLTNELYLKKIQQQIFMN